MPIEFHYPPDVFSLLVQVIPLLCRGKKDVLLFLQGAGVSSVDLSNVSNIVNRNKDEITKYDIVRDVLTRVNACGDSGLRTRREIIKRVVEFEEFSTCWPDDQLKAKGLVVNLREIVHVKDSFKRMQQERDRERAEVVARNRADQEEKAKKYAAVESLNKRLCSLFSMNDRPQERGKLLEGILNELFRISGILVHEDFRRKDPDNALVLEQIDGIIILNGEIHLVEMKWLKEAIGVAEIGPHLVRLFSRANASGIFISNSDYTQPAIQQCKEALAQKTIFLCSLREIVFMLQNNGNLQTMLNKKSQAAIIEKNPYIEILEGC